MIPVTDRALFRFLLLSAIVVNLFLWLASPPGFNETTLKHTWDVLHVRNVYNDSWGAMGQALDYLRSPHDVPVYTSVFFEHGRKFQYPLSSLLPFELVRQHVDLVGTVFLCLNFVAIAILLESRLAGAGWKQGEGTHPAVRVLLVAISVLTFYPIVKAFTLGQIQVWLNALFALALLAWATGRQATAGVLVGLMALIKPHYALFVLWGTLRRRWRFTTAATAVGVTGLVASVLSFGWSNQIDYLRVLSFLSLHGESFHPNQSVNGLLNRLAGLGNPSLFDNVRSDLFFPPYTPWVYAGTLITSGAILIAALARRSTAMDKDRLLDFCIMALSCTMASPIAWEHHYGVLLPIMVVLLTCMTQSRVRLVWLSASYLLASNYIQVTNLLANSRFNVLQSYLFLGALIVLALLYVHEYHADTERGPSANG